MAVHGRKSLKLSTEPCEGSELLCQSCDRASVRLPAYGFCKDCQGHLCDTCMGYHKRSIPSVHHILLDKDSMPKSQQLTSETLHSGKSGDATPPCPKHNAESIKYYCQHHDAILCDICETLEHSGTLCQVDVITEISEQTLGSREYTDILKASDTVIEKCLKAKADQKKKIAQFNNSLTDALTEMKQFREDVNKRLTKLEKATEDAATALQQDNDTRLKTTEAIYDDIIESQKASSDTIKQLNESKQADKLFLELKYAKQLITDKEKIISSMTAPEDLEGYQFKPNEAISALLKKEESLGVIAPSTTGLRQSTVHKTTAYRQILRQPEQWQKPTILQTPSQYIEQSQYQNRKQQGQAIVVAGQDALTASMLVAVPPQEQKQMLGERLFPLIQRMCPDLPGKITGMLLELDNSELLHMLGSSETLKNKVEEAMGVLQAYQAKEAATRQQATSRQQAATRQQATSRQQASSRQRKHFYNP